MESGSPSEVTFKNVVIVVFLTSILFFTAIDNNAIDGVIPLIQAQFEINGAEAAMIRTASSAVNTATLAVMWIFGEVVERRTLYLLSLCLWILLSLLAIGPGSQSFMIFVLFRSLAAAASAVLGVLTPVVFADIFRGKALGIVLMSTAAFELVAGTTLSFIYSALIVSSGLPWQTSLLPGPVIALLPLAGLTCLLRKSKSGKIHMKKDVFSGAFRVFSIKSFTFYAIAGALGNFHLKALLFWYPSMILSAWTYAPEAFYGLSYPSATAMNSLLILAGNVLGMPLVLWLSQSWHHGSGPFSGRSGYIRAYPIVGAVGSLLNAAMFTVDIFVLDWNFYGCIFPNFLTGMGSSAGISLGKLMLLMVLPNNSRTAALSLYFLIVGGLSTPSAQIIGYLFDIFLGDSTIEEDRFHAYQKAMLCSTAFGFAGALCSFAVIIFFKEDCKRAEEQNAMEERRGGADEYSGLLGKGKVRSDSVFDTLVRSRATTMELFN